MASGFSHPRLAILFLLPAFLCFALLSGWSKHDAQAFPATFEIQKTPDCRGNLKEVNTSLIRMAPAYPIHRIELLILKARLLRDRQAHGSHKEGLRVLKKAWLLADDVEKTHPAEPAVWDLLGQIDLIHTQYQGFPGGMRYASRSSKEIKTALSLNPDDPEAHFTRGLEDYFKPWFAGGSKEKALFHLQKALSSNPGNPRYLSWVGLALLANHHPKQGRFDIDRAADMCPGNPIYRRRAITQKPRG